jgi:hypothetical protein
MYNRPRIGKIQRNRAGGSQPYAGCNQDTTVPHVMTTREYTELAFIVVGITAGLTFHFASGDPASFSGETPPEAAVARQTASARSLEFSSARLAGVEGKRAERSAGKARGNRRRSHPARRARKSVVRAAPVARAPAPAATPRAAPRQASPAPRVTPVSAPTPRAAPRPRPAPARAPAPTKAAGGGGGSRQFDDSG